MPHKQPITIQAECGHPIQVPAKSYYTGIERGTKCTDCWVQGYVELRQALLESTERDAE